MGVLAAQNDFRQKSMGVLAAQNVFRQKAMGVLAAQNDFRTALFPDDRGRVEKCLNFVWEVLD